MEYIRNEHGCTIAKCCASCGFKKFLKKDAARICVDGNGLVRPKDVCPRWVLRDGLENAGVGGGRVKKKSYLDLVVRTREREKSIYAELSIMQRRDFRRATPFEMQRQYEQTHGTIYYDF